MWFLQLVEWKFMLTKCQLQNVNESCTIYQWKVRVKHFSWKVAIFFWNSELVHKFPEYLSDDVVVKF